ncbi:helix-turn-helix domain-containing protein [Proteiniborus sp. MB09-C3]
MKGVVIEVDMYKDIRQSYINGESQRDIAKRLGIARQTVYSY